MDNSKLDFLVRKNKGKEKLTAYRDLFLNSGFDESDLSYVDLESSDNILIKVRQIFPAVIQQTELLSAELLFGDSTLLNSILSNASSNACYIYTDDVYICGMYQVSKEAAVAKCLNLAKSAFENTCFVLDKGFKFSFTINFDAKTDKFDIQRKLIS